MVHMQGGRGGVENKENQPMSTSEVLTKLVASESVEAFYAENAERLQTPELTQYLDGLCKEKRVRPNDLLRETDIDRGFGYQIFTGRRRLSRDTALKLALGLRLTVEETQRLLLISKNNQLYPRVPRDAAILYSLHHGIGYMETQEKLFDLSMTLLGEDTKYEKFRR
jgi:hypothetical protein